MKLKEIQQRNYDAKMQSGETSELSPEEQFFIKIEERILELNRLVFSTEKGKTPLEMAQIIIDVLVLALYLNIDIQAALIQKTYINENRKD